MSDISLKVRWGPTKSYKLMNFDGTKSCQSIIEEIASKYILPPDDYHLYSPPTSTRGPLWMENETCLTQCGLQDRDTIEMKFTPATYYVCVGEGSNFNWLDSFTFSENHKNIVGQFKGDPVDPINEYIPVMRTFVTNTKEEYCFLHIKQENSNVTLKWLNSNVSLQEQQVKGGSFILLVQLSAVSSSKRIEAEALQLPTEKSGFLTKKSIKTHKVTNPKKRWCVLRGNFLYYYPSQSQTHASGIIPLEYYDVQQNRNKQKFELTLAHKEESFVANAPTYVLECEDEKEFRDWRHSIIRKSTIGAGTTVFGVMLSDVMSRKTNRNMIPSIITKAVEFLRDADRMKVQGLFRISGLNSAIAKYKEDFDRGLAVNFGSDVDPHVVSGLLKLYVRELPEPLLPFDLYKRFTSIDLSKDNTIQELSALVKEIPPNHRKVLVYLLELLRDVSEYAEENLMTVQNLAVVFGPNILRPREDTTGTLGDTSTVCAITELLIEQQSLIFPSTYAPKSATSSIPKGAFVLPPAGSLKPAVPKSTPPKPKTQRNPSFSSFIPGNPRTPREGSNSSQGLLLQNNRRSQKLTPSSKTNMGIQRSTPPDSPRTEQPELTAEFLYGMLQEEIQARKQLEKKLNSLQEILASLKNDCSSD